MIFFYVFATFLQLLTTYNDHELISGLCGQGGGEGLGVVQEGPPVLGQHPAAPVFFALPPFSPKVVDMSATGIHGPEAHNLF